MTRYAIDPHSFFAQNPQSNYEVDATGATALWSSTTTYTAIVPAGKIWLFWGGYLDGDAAETIVATIHDGSDNLILGPILSEADATVGYSYPDPALYTASLPIPLLAGWYVLLTFGGAQGVGAFASCIVTEVDAPDT